MTARIQVRRDTNSNWTSNDPVLYSGEFGFTTDTGDLRVGDGVTNWSSLPVLLSTYSAYTPTIAQGATADINKTVTYSKYSRSGDAVTYTANIAVTGSGTTTNDITVSLPVTAATSGLVVGSGYYWDASGNQYPCLVYLKSTSTVSFLRADTSSASNNTGIGNDPNIATASGDLIKFTCTYEVA